MGGASGGRGGQPLAPVASDIERLEYVGDLAEVLRQIALDGGHTRLAILFELAVTESEQLQLAYWMGGERGAKLRGAAKGR